MLRGGKERKWGVVYVKFVRVRADRLNKGKEERATTTGLQDVCVTSPGYSKKFSEVFTNSVIFFLTGFILGI